jgi:hypothetical protein
MLEALLDDPVFQRMESHNAQATSRAKQSQHLIQKTLQLLKLMVHSQPEGLERARRGMNAATVLGSRDNPLDKLGQLPRGPERVPRAFPVRDYGTGNAAGPFFLAQASDHIGQVAPGKGVDQISRCPMPPLVHAHVQRAVAPEAEPSPGLIQLHAGNAQIKDNSVHRLPFQLGHDGSQLGKAGPPKDQPPAITSPQPMPGALDGFGIPIQGENDAVGSAGLKNGLRITASAKSSVYVPPARTAGEELQDGVPHDGNVTDRRGFHGIGSNGSLQFNNDWKQGGNMKRPCGNNLCSVRAVRALRVGMK